MYLLSTSKETVLSNFADLKVQSIYAHPNGESTDFQCYSQKNIFVEVNKKSGLEILRLKEKSKDEIEIQRVRKLTIDNVYCVACAKQSLEEMAVGLSNGQIKLYNYKSSNFVHKFSADSSCQSVLHLDYNTVDSHIAAVFENGQIGIYGLTTKVKAMIFNIDKYSTLARFNPVKRFHLSIASHKGSVSIYDISDKKRVFHASETHSAPCRDLCSPLSFPDTLISVGYDCCINIFDLRRNIQPTQITCCHPLSTVAVSPCGNYFCVGNLKGELTTYDMRQLSRTLNCAKHHNSAVDRVTFIPSDVHRTSSSLSSTSSQNNSAMSVNILSDSTNNANRNVASNNNKSRFQRDSFCDFIQTQAPRKDEKRNLDQFLRRDSFDWESLPHKSDENTKYTPTINNASPSLQCNSEHDQIQFNGGIGGNLKQSPLDMVPRKLEKILEEKKQTFTEDTFSRKIGKLQRFSTLDHSDEEAAAASLSPSLKENITPTDTDANSITPTGLTCDIKETSLKMETNNENIPTNDNSECPKLILEMREEMLKRMDSLEFELKFLIDNTKWDLINHTYNLWSRSLVYTQELREDMALLLQTDPFTTEFARLKCENIALKQQIEQLKKKQHSK